jgi:hypothetical protein
VLTTLQGTGHPHSTNHTAPNIRNAALRSPLPQGNTTSLKVIYTLMKSQAMPGIFLCGLQQASFKIHMDTKSERIAR